MKRYSIIDGKAVDNPFGVFVTYANAEALIEQIEQKTEALSHAEARAKRLEDALQELCDACDEKERYVANCQRGRDAIERWNNAWASAKEVLSEKKDA